MTGSTSSPSLVCPGCAGSRATAPTPRRSWWRSRPSDSEGSDMRILVTGTEGYLGCLLAPTLLAEGHEVTGLDTGYYKAGWLYNGIDQTPHTIAKDIRDVSVDDLRGYEAVVHMA